MGYYLLAFLVVVFRTTAEGELLINDNSWTNCYGQRTLTILIDSFNNTPFVETQRVFKVNGTLPSPSVITTDIGFCSDEDHPDACTQENADSYLLNCDMLMEKNKPWSDFVQSFEPKLKCPLEEGVYRSEAPAKDVWKIFEKHLDNVRSGTYQVHLDVIDGRAKFICWEIEFEVKKV